MTLSEMTTNALRRANVIRQDQSATAAQLDDGIRRFNGLMVRYESDGYEIGDFPITSGATTIDVEREYEDAIEAMYALDLAKHYGLPLEQGLVDDADNADKFIRRNLVCRPEFEFAGPQGRAARPTYNINDG